MIIRTITCHRSYNHGAMLQTLALVTFLSSLGHDVKVIDYWPKYMRAEHRIPPLYNHWGIRQLYLLAKIPSDIKRNRRKKAFKRFYLRYIPVADQCYHSFEDLKQDPPDSDLYVAGSDQIWNTSFLNGKDPAFYLDFGTPKRKISYAASFATDGLKEGTEPFVKTQLANFDEISVREESALKILNRLGYNGCVVVDPVFLLPVEQWNRFDKGALAGEKYILIYDFEPKGQSIEPLAKRLARLHDCKIYSVGPYKYSYSDKNFVDVGPDVFVSLIKHARCVISNSFHGTAFSMIYQRDFFVVNRQDGLNVRMHDLLTRYDLINRLVGPGVSDRDLMMGIDYNTLEMKISRDIELSKSFLQRQLELVK